MISSESSWGRLTNCHAEGVRIDAHANHLFQLDMCVENNS